MSAAMSPSFKALFRTQAAALDWVDREHRRDDAKKSADLRFAETLALCEFGARLNAKGKTRVVEKDAKRDAKGNAKEEAAAEEEETTARAASQTRWSTIAEAWLRKQRDHS